MRNELEKKLKFRVQYNFWNNILKWNNFCLFLLLKKFLSLEKARNSKFFRFFTLFHLLLKNKLKNKAQRKITTLAKSLSVLSKKCWKHDWNFSEVGEMKLRGQIFSYQILGRIDRKIHHQNCKKINFKLYKFQISFNDKQKHID